MASRSNTVDRSVGDDVVDKEHHLYLFLAASCNHCGFCLVLMASMEVVRFVLEG
jgi:hypothetical protein